MRLLLSKIILREYDLLLLDEPTNHLDLLTKQALIRALDEYEGTIIFVSHDRYFVDEISNKILYFTNKKSYYHEGNYEEFKVLESQLFNLEVKEDKKEVKSEVKDVRKNKSISTSKLESMIEKIEKQIDELKKSQFDEEIYTSRSKMNEIEEKISELEKELEELEEEYLSR